MRYDTQWQCIFAGFSEVHKGGHFFWKYQDPNHPDYAGPDHPLSGALIEMYQALDRECAQICAEAGEDVNHVIVSDRGMSANYRGDHLVPRVLERLGLYIGALGEEAGSHDENGADVTQHAQKPQSPSLVNRLKEHLHPVVLSSLRRLTGRERADWAKTRVFQIADVGTSHLRVNLIGREPRGIVAPGEEYASVLALVEREFKALINPATGHSAVADVVFPQRQFSGPLQAELPDIGIAWSQEARVTALESPSIGRIEGSTWEQRSGNHTMDGGLLVSGPNFEVGPRRIGDLRELAPTVLALHGVRASPHYELGPMAELAV
jgi:predicted AlkP superfamily phosphohydrolase/phosphomutase